MQVIYRVPTTDRVVFITIDDGWSPSPRLARLIDRKRIPVTTFAVAPQLERHRKWFLARQRMTFENHSVTHPLLADRSYKKQRHEICGANSRIERVTGEKPVLFRPPGGSFSRTTERALASCGIKYLVMWNAIAEKGRIRINSGRLRPGDIILMHYIGSAPESLELLMGLIRRSGLRPALLRDYLN